MFHIDPYKLILGLLVLSVIGYFTYIYTSRKAVIKELNTVKNEKAIIESNLKARLFSQEELTKLKENKPHEEINLSVGTHTLSL